jgi:hypothetical protein
MLSHYPLLERENMDKQLFYDDLLLKSFLNYPDDVDNFPLNFPDITAAQLLDPTVQTYEAPGFAHQNLLQNFIAMPSINQWAVENCDSRSPYQRHKLLVSLQYGPRWLISSL